MVSGGDEVENGPFGDWGCQHSRGYLAIPVGLHASVDHANPDSKRGGVTVERPAEVALAESILTKRRMLSRRSGQTDVPPPC
jgi:hypothetical protein